MKIRRRNAFLFFLVALALSGCATVPAGPSILVLPGTGKSFEAFQADDAVCRQWASQQTGTTSKNAANEALAGGAALGTLMGAGLGAAIGSASGQAATGAGIGAASGAILGTGVGAGPAQSAGQEVQRRYDNAYEQCMYAKGNQIPATMRERNLGYQAIPPPPPPPNATAPPYNPVPSPPGGNPPPPPG